MSGSAEPGSGPPGGSAGPGSGPPGGSAGPGSGPPGGSAGPANGPASSPAHPPAGPQGGPASAPGGRSAGPPPGSGSGPGGPWRAPAATRPVRALIAVPGSKSMTNRALVLAALADSPTLITGPLVARDTQLMADGLRALGCLVEAADGPPGWLAGNTRAARRQRDHRRRQRRDRAALPPPGGLADQRDCGVHRGRPGRGAAGRPADQRAARARRADRVTGTAARSRSRSAAGAPSPAAPSPWTPPVRPSWSPACCWPRRGTTRGRRSGTRVPGFLRHRTSR